MVWDGLPHVRAAQGGALSCSGVGLVPRVARCVLRVAAHRALNEPTYWPDRMCGFDCHVYFK
eukprot:6883839-Prymnesium_polylepis.1